MRIFLNRLRVLFKNFFFLFNKNNMFDNKFLCTLAALIVTVVTICNITPAEGNITEKFILTPLTSTTKQVGISTANFNSTLNNKAFVDYSHKVAAFELDNTLVAPAGYLHGYTPNPSNKNYEKLYDILNETTDLNPIGTMSTIGADGLETDYIMYDRQINSISKSRTRGQGDMIRGDLLIAPCNTGWFQVSADPVADLQHGILSMITNSEYDNDRATLLNKHGGKSVSSSTTLSTGVNGDLKSQ